jgi:hypothetical protein
MRPRSQALQAPQAQRSSQAQQQPQLQQQPQPQQPQQSPQAQQSAQAQQSSQALRSPPSRQAPPSPQVPQTARRAAPDPNATHDRLQCHPTRQPTGIGWRYRTVALLVAAACCTTPAAATPPSGSLAAAPAAPLSATAQPTRVGVQVKLETFTRDDAQAIRAAGFSFVRLGIWTNALHDAAYRERIRAAFDAARSASLPVVATLRTTQPLATGTYGAARDEALALAGRALADAVADVEREFAAQLVAIELWNEPDLGKYWPTGDVLPTFAPYMRAACAALRAQPRSVPLYGFGFASAPLAGTLPDALLTSVLDGHTGCLDAVSYHAYGMTPVAIREAARDIEQRHRLPAVITEWGVPSAGLLRDPADQARRMRDFAAARADLSTPLVSIYEWKDTRSGDNARERSYGLVDASGRPKPALGAWRDALRVR